eukprot:gene13279-13410_t
MAEEQGVDLVQPVSAEVAEIAEAEAQLQKALELRDSDIDTAVELLGKVLEIKNKAYGEKALECADAYLYYGELLFEQAQANSDYFGEHMKSAAVQRARNIAAADGDDVEDEGSDGGEEGLEELEQDGQEGEKAAEQSTDKTAASMEQQQADQQPEGHGAGEAVEKDHKGHAANKAPANGPAFDQHEAEQPGPTSSLAAAEETPQQDEPAQQDDDEGQAAAEHEQCEDAGDEMDDGDDDEGSEDAEDQTAGEGSAGKEVADVTGESDDMALAWEMLEMARLIYTQHGGPATFANKLADCHMYIGDILSEQEKFEEAVAEYNTAAGMLAQVEGGLAAYKRRAAELDFKTATAYMLADQPAEALAAMTSAKAQLQTRIDELNALLDAPGAGSSAAGAAADAAGAAAFAAFASIVSSYTKPAEASSTAAAGQAANSGEEDEAAAVAAKRRLEIADLKGAIESIDDRIEELSAAVEAHISIKESLRSTFAMVAAGGAGDGEQQQQQQTAPSNCAQEVPGPVATDGGTGFAGPLNHTGPVKDIGVIGKGKRVAPTPAAQPLTAAAQDAAPARPDGSKEVSAKLGTEAGSFSNKRSLSDIVGSDQEGSHRAEATEAVTNAAEAKVAAAAGSQMAAAAPKKARV